MSNNNLTPMHPLLSTLPVDCAAGASDALSNCSALLILLADLFGNDGERYTTLESAKSRLAMWAQLHSIASILDFVNEAQFTSKAAD
jgi:hypothetical protein